jgi:muramoyltetrapeptide carboxypeptidase
MAGTPYQLDAKNKLVFIEDVGEKPYRIDRMLTQLRQTANLKEANGIVLGVFNDCNADPEDKNTLSLKETLIDRLGDLDIPVFYGFSFGHINEICTIPIGIEGAFIIASQELLLFENAVS